MKTVDVVVVGAYSCDVHHGTFVAAGKKPQRYLAEHGDEPRDRKADYYNGGYYIHKRLTSLQFIAEIQMGEMFLRRRRIIKKIFYKTY